MTVIINGIKTALPPQVLTIKELIQYYFTPYVYTDISVKINNSMIKAHKMAQILLYENDEIEVSDKID